LASPARPACLRRAAIPRPVTASGPPAHRCMGACCTLVAAADSSLRTRLRPLLAVFPPSCGRAEGRARPRAPSREPLALLSEASAELARPQRPEREDASESLSVLHSPINSDEHDAKAWCEEHAGAASPQRAQASEGVRPRLLNQPGRVAR
jgi:hypothetical protein